MAAYKATQCAHDSLQGSQGDPSPFFEPLLRSFLLGLGAAGIFESAHVASKVRLPAAMPLAWQARQQQRYMPGGVTSCGDLSHAEEAS